jgi:hypothetical protein
MVGVVGFEPTTLWSQTRCATRLRYTPMVPLHRIELQTSDYKTDVIPFNYKGNLAPQGGIEPPTN